MVNVKIFCLILVIVATFAIASVCEGDGHIFKTVHTNDGGVKGVKTTTTYGKVDYFAFRGIPYAENPIGNLRFKAPKPKISWKPNVLDATQFGCICHQLGELMPSKYTQSEDCLFLNIYVPADVKKNEKLSVLFFIHGGGYGEGSGNDNYYGPDFFIEKRTILVTFNYRLGIFGFLSLRLPEYSGNMGLKDQQLALKWIFNNIKHFDGDHTKITIFGQSAGAASVHHHILSTESRKYFTNAILMSGVASLYWAMSEYNNHLDMAYHIAADASKTIKSKNNLVEFLIKHPAESLVKYSSVLELMDRTFSVKFTPVIERPDAKEAFMTKTIEQLYETENINVNTLFTFASAEMLMVIIEELPKMFDIDGLNTNFSIKLPFKSLTLSPKSEEYCAINQEIRQFYFGNEIIDNSKSVEYVSLLSDVNMCYGIDKAAKLHAKKSKGKTYYARFKVDSKLNIIKMLSAQLKVPGACHCDDLCYLFKLDAGKLKYDAVFSNRYDAGSQTSIKTIDDMTNLFTNFAKLDHSRISSCLGMEPIQNDVINFLDITNEGSFCRRDPNGKAMNFWMDIERRMQKYIKPVDIFGL